MSTKHPLIREKLKQYAEQIIVSATEDLDYISTSEQVWNMVEFEDGFDLTDDEIEAVIEDVDDLIGQAEVTVEFPA